MATQTDSAQEFNKQALEDIEVQESSIPSVAPVSGGEPAPAVSNQTVSADPYAVSAHVDGYAPASNPDSPELEDTPGITEIAKDATSEQIEALSNQNKGPERLNIH